MVALFHLVTTYGLYVRGMPLTRLTKKLLLLTSWMMKATVLRKNEKVNAFAADGIDIDYSDDDPEDDDDINDTDVTYDDENPDDEKDEVEAFDVELEEVDIDDAEVDGIDEDDDEDDDEDEEDDDLVTKNNGEIHIFIKSLIFKDFRV